MIKNIFKIEASFDDLLSTYRTRADKIMVKMNIFLFTVCLALSPINDTYVSFFLVALPTLFLSYSLMRQYPGELITRIFMACSFMAYTGLIIHQTAGDIEAHFSAFGLIGILLYYRDWRTIAGATLFIYLHHLILGYAQTLGSPVYVFDEGSFWSLFGIHVAYFLPFVGMMSYLSIWLRREAYEEQHVIALAQEIAQGNLIQTDTISSIDNDTPLISAVVMMKNRLLDLLKVIPVPAAVIRIDTDSIVNINTAWSRVLGPIDDTKMSNSNIWVEPDTWKILLEKLHEANSKLLDKAEVTLVRSDGVPLLCEVSLILHEDIKPVMAILTLEDITQRREAERTMHRLAFRDLLTDLPNRASLKRELELAQDNWKTKNIPFAIAMLDLDGFKPVNDTYGHDAGDKVLRVVAARLVSAKRNQDFIARVGGDEFVVVLHNCQSIDDAEEISEQFIQALIRPIELDENATNVKVGTSIGVTQVKGSADTEVMMKEADIALYMAKKSGKNQVKKYRSAEKAEL